MKKTRKRLRKATATRSMSLPHWLDEAVTEAIERSGMTRNEFYKASLDSAAKAIVGK